MSIEIKADTLDDFFASARETAKEIDDGRKVTRKNVIWVEPTDLVYLLKPQRTKLVKLLRNKKRIVFSDLLKKMQRTSVSLNNDLKVLSKYQLVRIYKEPNQGHGVHKVIKSTFGDEKIEFRAEI